MQLQVPVIDNETCRKLQKNAGSAYVKLKINEHVICAGGAAGKGFWWGDSGGLLMLPIHQNGTFPFYQIGIVSYSNGMARENVPGIYTKVQFYADWIKKHVENWNWGTENIVWEEISINWFSTKLNEIDIMSSKTRGFWF